MKDYLHIKSIEIPLYKGKLVIIITNSVDKIKEPIPMFDDKHIYAHAWQFNYKNKEAFGIVLNFNSKYAKIKHGTITHEVIHATHYIMESRGVVADFNNDEHITYLAGWITDKVYDFINKKGFEVI